MLWSSAGQPRARRQRGAVDRRGGAAEDPHPAQALLGERRGGGVVRQLLRQVPHGGHATDRRPVSATGPPSAWWASRPGRRSSRGAARPGTSTTSTSGSPPASTCSSRTCSGGVRPARPRESPTGTVAPLEGGARLHRAVGVEAAEGVAGRQRQQGAGEPVPAQVGGLPRRLGPAPGQGGGDRPADLGAAAVAAAVGADQPERAVVRRRGRASSVEASSRASASGSTTVRTSKPSSVARAWKTRTPGPDSPPWRRISCTRTPVRPARWCAPASGSRLSATALRPHDPACSTSRKLGVGRGGAGDRLPVVATGDGAAEVGHGASLPCGPPGGPGPGAAGRRPAVRAGRCAARSPRPRCGRRRRACRGCWRRGPTRSWWR